MAFASTPGRKRKLFTTIALLVTLRFGQQRWSFSRSSSPNFGNHVVQERVIDNREFNSLEKNDREVILVKSGDSGSPSNVPSNIGRQGQGPTNFPTPPSGGRPSRPVYVPKYRTAPKIVDQGLGAGANPAGAGGGGGGGAAEFDNNSPVPKKRKTTRIKKF